MYIRWYAWVIGSYLPFEYLIIDKICNIIFLIQIYNWHHYGYTSKRSLIYVTLNFVFSVKQTSKTAKIYGSFYNFTVSEFGWHARGDITGDIADLLQTWCLLLREITGWGPTAWFIRHASKKNCVWIFISTHRDITQGYWFKESKLTLFLFLISKNIMLRVEELELRYVRYGQYYRGATYGFGILIITKDIISSPTNNLNLYRIVLCSIV